MAQRARDVELAAIALTDHDTTDGVAEAAREGATLGVRVIAGCEFSVRAPWGELHLLAYFVPPGDPRLETFLLETRAARRRRGEQMVARLQALGVDIDLDDVLRLVDNGREGAGGGGEGSKRGMAGALGRPHVARALVAAGASTDINDAFARYLGRGRPGYVEKPLPTLRQVTELVHAVGGLTVAAHLGDRASEPQVREFVSQGLDGLEVRHPSHGPAVEARLIRLAERLDLAVTGGSDWHGDTEFGESHAPLGGLDVPAEWLDRLEERREKALRKPVEENRNR